MDALDFVQEQWERTLPDIDIESITFWGRLKRAAGLVDALVSRTLADHDLSLGELEVLAALARSGDQYEMRPSQLTQSLVITPGAVTARLVNLEKRGLIFRKKDRQDRRVQIVGFTARGYELLHPALADVLEAIGTLLGALGDEKSAQIQVNLRSLLGLIDTFDVQAARTATGSDEGEKAEGERADISD